MKVVTEADQAAKAHEMKVLVIDLLHRKKNQLEKWIGIEENVMKRTM